MTQYSSYVFIALFERNVTVRKQSKMFDFVESFMLECLLQENNAFWNDVLLF